MAVKNKKAREPGTGRPIFAKRSLGQNFLVDGSVIAKILDSVRPSSADVVLEIGPGRGALTEQLVDRCNKVFALEFDTGLARLLRDRFSDRTNFFLVEGDALAVNFAELDAEGKKLRLVANLPYNISTAILQRLFDFKHLFSDLTLMFQREVAERITAPPGTSDRGYLSVLTERHFEVEPLFDVSPAVFLPVPKVWSSVVKLVPKETPPCDEQVFRDLVATGFAHKRKTILNNLKQKYPAAVDMLETSGIKPDRRAETLSLSEWLALASVSK